MSKYSSLFTSVNLLLGVGPLILPMPFFDAGIVLSILWMIIICLLSYNSAMFIAQSMSKLYHYTYVNRETLTLVESLVTSQEQDMHAEQVNQTQNSQQPKRSFDHIDQFQILFGKRWAYFPCISISVYLLGTSVSKCIMTGNIMKNVFKDVKYVGDFNFWVFLFFLSGAVFSFRSIDKTKIMQAIIIFVRIISLLMLIIGAVYLFCKDGVQQIVPDGGGVFNVSDFVQLFSNSVFSLMFHHSLPNIVNGLKNTQDVTFVIRNAFLISGSVLLVIPITGILAFGQSLGTNHEKLKYYNLDFQNKINFIYFFTSFYVFLNIAAFSVYIIVIRSNVLHIINPKIDPKKLSKQTIISSLVILALIIAMSLLLKDQIQVVLNFTGGIFGIFILFLMPCIQVYKARKLTHTAGNPKNYISWLPIAIGLLGLAFMGLNLYHIISKM